MRKAVEKLAVVAAAATIFGSAQAGELYTIRTSDDMLRKFDTNTLSFTDIGTIGTAFDFGGMAYDTSTGTMYLVQGFAGTGLYTVDLNNGSTSLVGSHGYDEMFSLAYDPTTDTLFGGLSTTGTGFFDINRSNGSATLIGDPGINLDGLVYDPLRDDVVGAYAGPGDLYSMNRSTGQGTLLYDGDFFNNCGIAYDADTDLYWMIDWSGNMYTFDPNNGYARSLVLSGLGAHDSLASTGGPTFCLDMTVNTLVAGGTGRWDIAGADPGAKGVLVYGMQDGTTVVNGSFGYCATFGIKGVNQNKVVGFWTADGNGNATVRKRIPGNVSGVRVLSQAAQQGTCPDECMSNIDDQVVQ